MSNHQNNNEIKAYIYMSYANMQKVLAGRRLKVRSIEECNDSYECMPAGPEGEMWQKVSPLGFLCFSETCKCSAMWGHYADKHKGVCLEFTFPQADEQPYLGMREGEAYRYHALDINMGKDAFIHFPYPLEPEKQYAVLFDVFYRTDRAVPGLGMTGYLNSPGSLICDIDKAFVTKDASWSYEREKRILIPMEEEEKYVDCFHKYLTGIILGIRCEKDMETVEQVIDIFREEGDGLINVYKAQYAQDSFEVDIPGL